MRSPRGSAGPAGPSPPNMRGSRPPPCASGRARLFGAEDGGIAPDILCVGKALTGGYMSLAATLMTRHVADTISDEGAGVFMHGPTFMANPLSCAVALASIDLLLAGPWQSRIAAIEQQ